MQGGGNVVAGETFTPEIFNSEDSSYYPICGHNFWDNDHGAATACAGLGFRTGEAVITNAVYNTDAMPVGSCIEEEPLNTCTNGGNDYGNFDWDGGSCRAGNMIGVDILCTDAAGLPLHLFVFLPCTHTRT